MNITTLNGTSLDGGVIKIGGGGATINNQDKVVDITENGTTEVVADGGFTGLGKVTINTEVSGGEGGGSDWHYFDVSGLDTNAKLQSLQTAMTYKVRGEDIESLIGVVGVVMPAGFGNVIPIKTEEIKAIGMDYSTEVRLGEQSATIGQSVTSAPWYGQAPEITKEQFYSLD